jgi:two-component system sensor histidine kinase HydH
MSARSQRHIADAVEQVLACTPEAERLLGLSHGKLSGVSFSHLPPVLQALAREILTNQKSANLKDQVLVRDGKHARTLQVNALPLPAPAGTRQVLMVLNDLTGFQQLEQSITRLDRLATIGTLAASMAHEIKNALVAVKAFVDLLLEKNKDAELATIVGREMNRVNSIVRQLLKFGSPGGPAHATVKLHDVLEHSLRMVQHQLDHKLISIQRSFNATPDAVQGDDCQLEQVFVNLFLNAIEATGDNGTLTVATELLSAPPPNLVPQPTNKPHVRVIVTDTGMGIAPENLDRMFEPFFTTKSQGTGLGLPITRRIVQEHNGQITVVSEPRKGTTFSIIFPVGGKAH